MSGVCHTCEGGEDVFQVVIRSFPPKDGAEHLLDIDQDFDLCLNCRNHLNNQLLAFMMIATPPGTFSCDGGYPFSDRINLN